MSIPTVQQCVDAAVAALESNLGQDVPTYEKSFLRVLAVIIGMNNAELYRFGTQRLRQVLALTATGTDLDNLGREYGIERKPATKAIMNLRVYHPNTGTVVVTPADVLRSLDNGMYYFPLQTYTSTLLYYMDIQATAEFAGPDGELEFQSLLEFSSVPEHASGSVSALSVDTPGANEETDDELRSRILDEIQTVGGGSNSADYRRWGQLTPNVARVDPYTGLTTLGPISGIPWAGSIPGERTVFVEATTSFDTDGVPDATLLDLVKDYIQYDQVTGRRNPCLGSTDDTLTVSPITRSSVYFEVRNLSVESSRLLECQLAIDATLDTLMRGMRPFILGLDTEVFRRDVVSSTYAARHVQRVVQGFGGSVGSIGVGMSYGNYNVETRTMNPGERHKAVVLHV